MLTADDADGGDLAVDFDRRDVGRLSGKGAMLGILARVAVLALQLGVQAILARWIAPAEFGVLAMGLTVMALINVVRDFGLQSAGVHKAELTADDFGFLFWVNLLVMFVVAALGVASAPLVGAFYQQPRAGDILTVMCLAAMVGGISAQHTMLLRRSLRFGMIGMIDVAALALGVLASLVYGYYDPSVWALVMLSAVQQLATTVLSLTIVRTKIGPPRLTGQRLSLVRFGGNLALGNVIYFITNNFIAVLIGRNIGDLVLGQFNRAWQIYVLPSSVLSQTVYSVSFSALSRLRGVDDEYRSFFLSVVRRVSALYYTLAGFLIVASDYVALLLLGPNWSMAGTFLQILSIGLIGVGTAQMSGVVLQTQDRLYEYQVWGIVDGAVRIGAIIACSHWAPYGYALGFALATTFLTAPASLVLVGRKGPIRFMDQVRVLAPNLLLAVLSALGAFAVHHWLETASGLLGTVACGLGSLAAIACGAIVFAPVRALAVDVIADMSKVARRQQL